MKAGGAASGSGGRLEAQRWSAGDEYLTGLLLSFEGGLFIELANV